MLDFVRCCGRAYIKVASHRYAAAQDTPKIICATKKCGNELDKVNLGVSRFPIFEQAEMATAVADLERLALNGPVSFVFQSSLFIYEPVYSSERALSAIH